MNKVLLAILFVLLVSLAGFADATDYDALDLWGWGSDDQPHLKLTDLDGDSWIKLDFSADDTAELSVGGSSGISSITIPGISSYSFTDDIDLALGTGDVTDIEYTTADANANLTIMDLPAGDGTDVPGFGLVSSDADLGLFDGYTVPFFFVTDDDGDSYTSLESSGDDAMVLETGGNATGITITTTNTGADINLDAADEDPNSSQEYVNISGTVPAHVSGSPTDIFLDFDPTLGINTGAANVHLIDMTFTSPVWASSVTSNLRGIYFAPTIGAATAGTNSVNMIEVANYTGDAQVNVTALKIGTSDGLGTSNAISIGTGWDAGIDTDSPVTLSHADADLDVEDNITCGDAIIDEAAGVLDFSGATSGTISTSTGTADLVLDSADDADGSDKTYVSITGSTPAHSGGTPTNIFLDISPTLGVNTVATTTNLMDLTFSSPAWATAVSSTLRGAYFAPTIGNATTGTNTVAILDVAAITGDDEVDVYGLRFGAMTGGTGTENAIEIGTGWDNGINSASPIDVQADITLENDEDFGNSGDGVVTLTGDDDTGIDLQIISKDHDTTGDALLTLDADAGGDAADTWILESEANGNDFTLNNAATELWNYTTGGDVIFKGTTPAVTIGDNDAEDASLEFDGTQDFYVGLYDTDDDLTIGTGSTIGSSVAISITDALDVTFDGGSVTVVDDEYLNLGSNSDYQLTYDETSNDQLLLTTTATAANTTGDPMFHFVADDGGSGMTADQEVFGIAKGSAGATDLFVVDEDGDVTANGDATISGGDIDLGSSGAAGTVDIFPSTASSGKIQIAAADSGGDYTTTITNASQGAARTYTIPAAGGDANFVMMTSAQNTAGQLDREDLSEDALEVYGIPLQSVWDSDGTPLTGAASAGFFGLTSGNWGTGTITLDGEAASGASKTSTLMFEFVLPPEYVDDADVKLVVQAYESVGAANGSTTLSAEVYEQDENGGVSADLYNAFDTTDITTSWAECTAVITDSGLVAGDRLVVLVRIVCDDSGGSTGTVAQIGSIEIQCDIKG